MDFIPLFEVVISPRDMDSNTRAVLCISLFLFLFTCLFCPISSFLPKPMSKLHLVSLNIQLSWEKEREKEIL